MNRELTPQEIIYDFKVNNFNLREDIDSMPEYDQVYEKIETALEIDKEGYNVYLIDDFSKDKLEKIIEFARKNFETKDKPQDICYVVHKDEKCPKSLFLPGGKGVKLKETLENIQKLYAECTYEFYSNSSNKEKEEIVENLQKKRSDLINKLVKMAEDDGFTMKATQNGFTFIPLKEEGELMNESDYEDLKCDKKEDMLNKVSNLKNNAQEILEKLKDIELSEIEKIKKLMEEYYNKETEEIRKQFLIEFEENTEVVEFLKMYAIILKKI